MNKLFRKLFVLFLALTVAFAAVGCDGCGGGGDSYVPDTSVVQPETPVITMKSERSLIVGDEVYLSPTTKNVDGDLVWTSENPDVATVSNNGIVTANKAGTTKISASYNGVTAYCNVTVSYGNYIPNVATYSGIEVEGTAKTVLTVGGNFTLGAYVDFNNNVFNDATFTYASSNEEVLTVEADGTVKPHKSGDDVVITVNATWRDFTVSKSFNVNVRDNVLFYMNDNFLQNIVIDTPASYLDESERNNIITFNPTVKVGPNATVDNNVKVEVEPMDTTVEFSYDETSKIYTALAIGKTLIKLTYEYEGSVCVSSFTIEAVRPTAREITLPVELYSAGTGTYKVKNEDGTYTNKTLVDYAWGNGNDVTDVTLYDAYQDGESLAVNGEIVENVLVNFDSLTDTSITLGTKTESYVIYLNDAIAYYISDAYDLVNAVDKTNKASVSSGLYVLLNDIDMTGAPAIMNATAKIKFNGVFDGKGYTIYNPVVDMSLEESRGFLGVMQAGSILRDTAFININSIGHRRSRGWITSTASNITFENLYVDINENMELRAGMFGGFGVKADNIVINQRTPENFDLAEWFVTKGASQYGASAFAVEDELFDESTASKLNNVYLISRKPAHYYWSDKTLSEPYYKDNAIELNSRNEKRYGSRMAYGENETELHYVYEYFTKAVSEGGLGLENPTVQSVIAAMGDYGKISVLPNFRVYDTFSEISVDQSDKHKENITKFESSSCWTVVNGMPFWKGVYENTEIHDDYFGLTMGDQSADLGVVADVYTPYKLGITTVNPALVSELKFTVPANDFVEIDADNVLKAKAVQLGTTITATANFKYNGVDKTMSFPITFNDSVSVNSVITVDGVDIDDSGINLEINDEAIIGVNYNGTAVENDKITLSGNVDTVATVDGTKLTAVFDGKFNITVTFKVNDNDHVLVAPVSCYYPYKKITDAVHYEASTGVLETTAIEGTVFEASVGEEVLNESNGGLIIDGDSVKFRAKTSPTDTNAGIPYMWNKEGESNVFILTVKTKNNTYVFEKVSYWSIIINDESELKQAMGYDVNYAAEKLGSTSVNNSVEGNILKLAVVDKEVYYLGKYNVGLYRLGNDIDMKETDIGYTNNELNSSTLGGYAGLLDGFGYSIINFKPGTQGLFGQMNSYNRGSQVDKAFGTDQPNYRAIPFIPTIRNIAFEDVITEVDKPVIAASSSHNVNFVGRPPVIENIYVTVSNKSTGSAGIIGRVNKGTKTNNVYVVNNNDFGQFIELDGTFKFNDREGAVTIPESRVFYNPISTTAARNSSLFGRIGDSANTVVSKSVENTTNVYVVSKLPLMHYNGETNMSSSAILFDETNKTASLYLTFKGGYDSTAKKVRSYGYAANETVATIPTIHAIKANFLTEFNANYDTLETKKLLKSDMYGYYCSVCYEPTFAGLSETAAGSACTMTDSCTGTLIKVDKSFWNCPAIYEWTLPNLATETSSEFNIANGTIKFKSAYKYNTVDDMKSANLEFTSFTGDAGNGLWKVVEGELIWVGAQA